MCEPSCNCDVIFMIFPVEMIPNVFSWTREPPRCLHALFWEYCRIHHSSPQFTETGSASLFFFARHCRLHWNFQHVPSVFVGFFFFLKNSPSPGCMIKIPLSFRALSNFVFFDSPFMLFFLLSGFPHFGPNFRPQLIRSGSCLNHCQSLHQTTKIPLELSQQSKLCESFP